MADPAEGIKDLLVTAGVGVFAATSGWGIFIASEPNKPDTAITINSTGGQPSNPRFLVDFPSVQVMVRGDENGYQALWTKVKAVKDALLGLPSQDLSGDRWVAINQAGNEGFLGFDDNNRPRFSLNFNLIIEPATGTHRISL